MPTFKLPLSGDVAQTISPWSNWFSGGQYGLVNINLGMSSEPKIEEEVLSDIGTYGKQLGRIGDVLIVLMNHLPKEGLPEADLEAISALRLMLAKIADVKEKHKRPALRP